MKSHSATFLVLMFLLFCIVAQAQDQNFIKLLEQNHKVNPQEKVHLHLDKSLYLAGDTIWFQAYVVKAEHNIPSEFSEILYLDVINDQNQVLQTLQLPLVTGFAPGSFAIPDTWPRGSYMLRAYTNLMRKTSSDYFFIRSVMIMHSDDKITMARDKSNKVDSALLNSAQIQFFPEGGSLLSGFKSSLAFKAIGVNGTGIPVKGFVADETNHRITEFESDFAGMGSFSFLPIGGKEYTAHVTYINGSKTSVVLPSPLSSGYLLSADNSQTDSLYIRLNASADLINQDSLTFVPLSNGVPLFYMKTKFPENEIFINIPKNKLPGGIIQLALLNKSGLPLAQRLVFNPYQHAVNFDLGRLKTTYSKRELVQLDLQNRTAQGKTAIGNYSISVINADQINESEEMETTIFSNLLLSSDVKGYIEKPNYYFTNPSSAKTKELDNLMLTQTWTRFTWKNLSNEKDKPLLSEEKITISGSITGSGKTKVGGIPITLLAGELIGGVLLDTLTDAAGKFTFYLDDELKFLPIRLQVKAKNNAAYKIKLDDYLVPEVPLNLNPENQTFIPNHTEPYKDKSNQVIKSNGSKFDNAIKLKDVEIRNYDPTPKLSKNSTSVNMAGGADKIFTADFIGKFPTLKSIFLMLPGVIPNPKGSGYVQRSDVGMKTPALILILVDGVESDQGVSTQDIESIEFLKSAAYAGMYGIRGAGGVIIITTKKGPDGRSLIAKEAPNSLIFNLPLYVKKEFYAPNYSVSNKSRNSDLRTTVFWKGDVVTDSNGKANISYFNNDVPGNYKIVIEGVSTKGALSRQIFRYKVE